jgi:hypothetical protein
MLVLYFAVAWILIVNLCFGLLGASDLFERITKDAITNHLVLAGYIVVCIICFFCLFISEDGERENRFYDWSFDNTRTRKDPDITKSREGLVTEWVQRLESAAWAERPAVTEGFDAPGRGPYRTTASGIVRIVWKSGPQVIARLTLE